MALTIDRPMREERDREGQIDRQLHTFVAEWLSLDETLEDWGDMDDLEQMDFLAEWPLTANRLRTINTIAGSQEMNRDQFMLFVACRRVVSNLLPRVNRLIQENGVEGGSLTVDELGW